MLRASASPMLTTTTTTASQSLQSQHRALEVGMIDPGSWQTFALQGGAEFVDSNSYQSRALQRVAMQLEHYKNNNNNIVSSNTSNSTTATPTANTDDTIDLSDAKLAQFYALYCIYEATNGQPNVMTVADSRFDIFDENSFPTWRRSDGWDVDDDWSDPCGMEEPWFGVTCDDEGRVIGLDLHNNFLTGAFPPEVKLLAGEGGGDDYDGAGGENGENTTSKFTNLGAGVFQSLDLYQNPFLFNNFDNSWMTDLGIHFEYLFVGNTAFAGRFPELPPGVLEVDFAYTMMHRGFDDPKVFANAQLLEYLNMGGNALNTTIPESLSSLPHLQYLYLNDCQIHDTDLSYLENMPALYEHWADNNPNMVGTIPSWIGNKTSLASLSLTANGLSGPLPTEIAELSNLQQLWLYDNQFTGTIPVEWGEELILLSTLEVAGNDNLVGDMPMEICGNTGFFGRLATLGADCDVTPCSCCSCCSLQDCQPSQYPNTEAPTEAPRFVFHFELP